jgi:hypothetical protein
VTGSTRETISSDQIRWNASFSREVPVANLKAGYEMIKKDQSEVLAYMVEQSIATSDVVFSTVALEKPYEYNQNLPKNYILRQNVLIRSNDVEKVTGLAQNVQRLIDRGVVFSSSPLEYYYSELPRLRVSLLPAAIKDAKSRAEIIAKSSGRRLGYVQSVNMGPVQVLAINSTGVSDYGNYDTSSKEKEVMVAVNAVFRLQ